ncbi:Uncharacterized protein OBRU01_15483 [Operophtera brumata]|uniref:Nucleolus and neural progenitor protein-like N-terminal domain-containing protein n=1 Tax=Operophtera brumata TaxID=104452 RepID=A0A0L7L4I9_OPEBR|nr:Uncharacterized protein OBRU01_15483 [Operophtera brumata]
MLEPWKLMCLPPPPVQTTRLNKSIDVKGLEHACDNILRVLSKQYPLHKESALLSRFLYKYDKKFRNDIGYRNIRKTNSTLKKYLQLNLYKDIENFMAVLPKDDEYFPTRQMLEYVLVRIIAFSKIMLRIYVCSKRAAVFYLDRVKRGESHWMSLMPYALLSRMCSLSTVLLHHSTSWYACLYHYLTQLQSKGLKFLPSDYDLPADLDKWLDLKNIDNFGRFNWSQKKNINAHITMLDIEEHNTFDNILGYISKINEETELKSNETLVLSTVPTTDDGEAVSRDELLLTSAPEIDHGVAISRESLHVQPAAAKMDREAISQESINILNKFQKKISSDFKVTHYFGKVTNQKSLTDFIDKEEMYRNDGDERSLTCHLSFMQWQSLKSSLIKACDALSRSRKVEKKLQKVWKEKCLDCV